MQKGKNFQNLRLKQLNPYQEKKRQIKQIIHRIDKKMSLQIFLERSEGSLIQNQIKYDLQKLKKQKIRAQTFCFPTRVNVPLTQRKIKTENPSSIARSLKRNIQAESLKADGSKFSQQFQQKIKGQSKENQQKPLNMIYLKKTRSNFRPQLQQLSQYLSVKDQHVLERRRRIVQLLILCLMRRFHNKIYEALDIAIELSSYFQQNYNQTILKCICYKLIGRLYKQIKIQQNKKSSNIKNTNRVTRQIKRHSSFMIKTLASQRVFFNQFHHKYNIFNILYEKKKIIIIQNENALQNLSDFNNIGLTSQSDDQVIK